MSQYPFQIDQTQNLISSVTGRAPVCVRPQAIVNAVVGSSFPGAVIGLHDGGGDRSETVVALP